MSADSGQRVANLTKQVLQKMRNNECFKAFYDTVVTMRKTHPSISEPALPRQKQAHSRFAIGTGPPSYPATPQEHYIRIHFEAIYLMVNAIDNRFNQASFEVYAKMVSLLVKCLTLPEIWVKMAVARACPSYTFIRLHAPSYTPSYTFMHLHTPPCTFIHLHPPSYTSMHLHTPSYTSMHLHAPSCTFIHLHAPPCTFIHFHIPSCPFIHLHTLLYTCRHNQTPSYTFIDLQAPSYSFIHFHAPSYTFIHPHAPSYTSIHLFTHSYTLKHVHTLS